MKPQQDKLRAGVAQTVERLICNQDVEGSIPFSSTTTQGNKNEQNE